MKTSSYIWIWNKFSFLRSATAIRFVCRELSVSRELALCFWRHKGLIRASTSVKVLFEGICCTFNSVYNTYSNWNNNSKTSYTSNTSFLTFKSNIQFFLKMFSQHANKKRFCGWCGWNVSYIFFSSSITADTALLSIHEYIHKEVYPRKAT